MDSCLLVERVLPDGKVSRVKLYHVSLEGLESALICRDEEDYDFMVKNIFLRSLQTNVIVVIYGVVSNHAHVALLAESKQTAEMYANQLKKVLSMWLHRKYGEENILLGKKADVSPVTTIQYARNVLAYIPRNALDNGAVNIESYKWTGYRGMFCSGQARCHTRKVSEMSTRNVERIMHTGANLSEVKWRLNDQDEIEPASACDWQFLEMVFRHNQAFFLSKIGSVNVSEINYLQSIEKSAKMTDSDFMKKVDELSLQWFQKTVDELSSLQKAKFLNYLEKKIRLSLPQVARCLKMKRVDVARILGRKIPDTNTKTTL